MAGDILADARTGKNGRHALVGMLRQSVFVRSPPTRFVSSFMRSPIISATFCARWRRRSRSRIGR
jgi:hypothetical protein